MIGKTKIKCKYNILLLFPPVEYKGGVVDFCRMLINNLSSDFQVDHFNIVTQLGKKGFIKRPLYLIPSVYKLIKSLLSNHYDLIQLNPSFKEYSLIRDSIYLLIIIWLGLSKKTLVFFHGWDQDLAAKIEANFFLRGVFRWIYKKAAIIFVLYNHCKEQLVNIGIEHHKIKISTTMYESIENKEEYSGKKKDGKLHILFLSRFLREKGVYIAADVVRLLVDNGYKDFRIMFAGDGPEYENLKGYISRYGLECFVDIPGYISGKEKNDVFEQNDIFLFPTYYGEGCPVVIMEAMGAGQAVISTPRGAIPDIVEHNINGFIIDSRDPRDFYEAVLRLLEDRELLNRMQKLNMKKAQENYEARVVTKKIESIYLAVIND